MVAARLGFEKTMVGTRCALARWFCVSRKGGSGGGGWGHRWGAVHMVAARLGFEKTMVGTRCALARWFCVSRKGGTGEGGWGHRWLLGLALKRPWLVPGARLRAGSASAERVGGVTGGVLCTWWLLGLALKRPWLVPGGPPPALTAWTGLENTTLTLQRAGFWPERLLGLWAGVWQPIVLTITCSLMSGRGQSHETAY